MNNKYIFKVLKCVVFCVFYDTFYKLQNSSKVYTQNVGNMAFQGLYREIFPEPQRFLAPSALAPPPPPPKTKLYAYAFIICVFTSLRL